MKCFFGIKCFFLCLVFSFPAMAAGFPGNGNYSVNVTLTGGSGRASIQSPAEISVKDDEITATVIWSSSSYDRMTIDGVDYYPISVENGSTFAIPVRLNEEMPVTAETLAMSQPHEIEYVLYFDGSGFAEGTAESSDTLPVIAIAVLTGSIIAVRIFASKIIFILISLFTLAGCSMFSQATPSGTAASEITASGFSSSETISGLSYTGSMERSYAQQFSVDYYENGCSLITIADKDQFLLVPEDTPVPDADLPVIRQPVSDVYLVATSAMCLFDALDGLDAISLSGTKPESWTIENARLAMEAGDILYAGKYSEPDYELILSSGCQLSIQSTMIYHTPEVKEKLEELGIPVLVDYSSYESHPLGRTEWVRLYGLLLGKEEQADALFQEQQDKMNRVISEQSTGKTVAFFYVSSSGGYAVIRKSGDYVAKMISLAGGRYLFEDTGGSDTATATVNMTMEDFYAAARDADIIIYNSTIDGQLDTVSDFLALNPLFEDFKAVQEHNVWCTGANLYQDMTQLGTVMEEMHRIFTGDAPERMEFLYRLDS